MKFLLNILIAVYFLLPLSSAWSMKECPGSPYKGDDLSKIKHWDNCEGTIIFNSGEKYVGEFKNGLSDGQGTLYYLADNQWKGDKYMGEFKFDEYDGQGAYAWNDGKKYIGEF